MAMTNAILRSVLDEYGIDEQAMVKSFGSGLINNTWIVNENGGKYILQRINDNVFKDPAAIAYNIEYIALFLKNNFPGYKFASPITTPGEHTLIYKKEEGYFRMFSFIEGSHTVDVVETPGQAYEAAGQFGKFTRILNDLDVNKLKITIPDFHDLSLRYRQFLAAVENGNVDRKKEAATLIQRLLDHSFIVDEYEKIRSDKNFIPICDSILFSSW